MVEFDIKKEGKKFVAELRSKKRKVEKSKNFELDYTRQYELSDHEYYLSILSSLKGTK